MSSEPTPSRYRRELKTWSKNELVREVERLRALTREHARRPGEDTTGLPGSIVDVAGDPHAQGGALVDARNAILLDEVDWTLETWETGELGWMPAHDQIPYAEAQARGLIVGAVCLGDECGGIASWRHEGAQVFWLAPAPPPGAPPCWRPKP